MEVQDPPFLWRFLVVITCLVHGYHVLVTRLQSGNNAVSWKEGVEFSAPFFFIRSERSSVKYQVKIMYTPFLGAFFPLQNEHLEDSKVTPKTHVEAYRGG